MDTTLGRYAVRHLLLGVLVVLGVAFRIGSADGFTASSVVTLAAGVAGYVVCVRWGCWRWLAALAALPAYVDSRVLDDQTVRPALGLLLVSAGLAGLAWPTLRARGGSTALAALVLIGLALPVGTAVRSSTTGVAVPTTLSGLAAAVGVAAAFGVARADPVALRLAAIAAVAAGSSSALAEPVWWPVAGAIGLTGLLRGRRGRAAARSQTDAVDGAALAAFDNRYGEVRLGFVVIVIAAYNEAEGIPAVLHALPAEVCGLAADVVVVDDGSSDGTAAALEDSRALVVTCGTNRGQGAALRLGYRIARERGATYVVTTDADGQYDVADLPAVLTPILEDRADFVTGSRILGHQHTYDRVRRTGVHVFAWCATVLTGHHFTDTSFGLRAMRAEVTATVTLNQKQYQASELLLGVVSHGFRALEVPATMHVRSAGSTKKGRNLAYGRRYAGVMTSTWWREGCPRPVTETAPALRQTGGHGTS